MTDSDILTVLKTDLLVSSTALDAFLNRLIASAKKRISTEGITLSETDIDDGMLVEQYAAWLYRSRREGKVMPRSLRWALNNRLLKEKGEGTNG